jgi:hypothetical protein
MTRKHEKKTTINNSSLPGVRKFITLVGLSRRSQPRILLEWCCVSVIRQIAASMVSLTVLEKVEQAT